LEGILEKGQQKREESNFNSKKYFVNKNYQNTLKTSTITPRLKIENSKFKITK